MHSSYFEFKVLAIRWNAGTQKYPNHRSYEQHSKALHEDREGAYDRIGYLSTSEYIMVLLGADTEKSIQKLSDYGYTPIEGWLRLDNPQRLVVQGLWLQH